MDPGGPGCTEEHLAVAEQALGAPLPQQLREVFLAGDFRYREDGQWWVVWPLTRVLKVNTDAWRRGTLSRTLVAFGDDGTGNPFCVPLDGSDEVLRWSWIDEDVEASEGPLARFLGLWVAGS